MFQWLRMFWRRSMVLTDLKISFIPSFPRPILTGVSQVSQVSLEISPFFLDFTFFFRFDSRIRPGFEYPRDGIESCLGGFWCQKPILWFLKKWGESIQFHKRYYVSIIFNFAPHLPFTQNFSFSKSAFRVHPHHSWLIKGFQDSMRWDMDSTNLPACWPFIVFYMFSTLDLFRPYTHDMTRELCRWPTHHKEDRCDEWRRKKGCFSKCKHCYSECYLSEVDILFQYVYTVYTIPFFTKSSCISAIFGWYGCTMFEHSVSTSSTWSLARRVKKFEELRCLSRLRGQFFFNGLFLSSQSQPANLPGG